MLLVVGSLLVLMPSRASLNLLPLNSPQRHTMIRYVSKSFSSLCICFGGVVHNFLCRVGADLLLQSEGTRLSDEERPRSSGNHQAEPTLGGWKLVYTERKSQPVVEAAVTPITIKLGALSGQEQCLHYCWTLFLNSHYPDQSRNQWWFVLQLGGKVCLSFQIESCRLYFIAQGGSDCVSVGVFRQKHTLLMFNAVD